MLSSTRGCSRGCRFRRWLAVRTSIRTRPPACNFGRTRLWPIRAHRQGGPPWDSHEVRASTRQAPMLSRRGPSDRRSCLECTCPPRCSSTRRTWRRRQEALRHRPARQASIQLLQKQDGQVRQSIRPCSEHMWQRGVSFSRPAPAPAHPRASPPLRRPRLPAWGPFDATSRRLSRRGRRSTLQRRPQP